jgi:predicted DNA-binding protein YlxM (UPF0122 family)
VKKHIKQDIPQELLEGGSQAKEEIEALRRRVRLLSGKDKVMMTMYIDYGANYRQLARLMGISETSAARRIKRLTRRLADERYVACVQNRNKLTRLQLRIAREYLAHGLPMTKIASKYNLSYYVVRKNIRDAIETTASKERQAKPILPPPGDALRQLS